MNFNVNKGQTMTSFLRRLATLWVIFAIASMGWFSVTTAAEVGSAEEPLRVMLVPTDGGTEEGTKATNIKCID